MIITGGVNVYPREVEDLLVQHPDVGDVAVLGVPDDEYGERVMAVVQPAEGVVPGPQLAATLIDFCRTRLAHVKCPRSVEFTDQLPCSDAGKMQLGVLQARYGGASTTSPG